MNKIERVKKLYKLAMQGFEGEKETAQTILDKLIKKYDLSLEDLQENVIKEYDLKFQGRFEKKLLVQIVFKVTNGNNFYNLEYVKSGKTCRNIGRVCCTDAQLVEIKFLFDFYKKLWNDEISFLMEAFVQKHKLFGETLEGESGTELDDVTVNKIIMMMHGLSDKTPLIGIEEATE